MRVEEIISATIARRRSTMRPGLRDVRRWFAQCVAAATVAAHLTTLHADPNWRVRYTRGATLHTLSLFYSPTGESIEVVLLRVGAVYYPRLDTPLATAGWYRH